MALTVDNELVQFDEVHEVVLQGVLVSKFVVLRSKEDTNDRLSILVAPDRHVVGERFVVQTMLTSLGYAAVGVILVANGHSVVQHGVERVEVRGQFVYGHGFDADTREEQIVYCIFRQILLVSKKKTSLLRDSIHLSKEPEATRIADFQIKKSGNTRRRTCGSRIEWSCRC